MPTNPNHLIHCHIDDKAESFAETTVMALDYAQIRYGQKSNTWSIATIETQNWEALICLKLLRFFLKSPTPSPHPRHHHHHHNWIFESIEDICKQKTKIFTTQLRSWSTQWSTRIKEKNKKKIKLTSVWGEQIWGGNDRAALAWGFSEIEPRDLERCVGWKRESEEEERERGSRCRHC